MIEQAQQAYAATKQAHETVYLMANKIRSMMSALSEEKTEMADLIIAINEAQKFADDTKKELNALRSQFDKLLCALCVRDNEMGRIYTDYGSALPDFKMAVSVPSRSVDPEGFLRTMRAVGIPEALLGADGENPIPESVRLHYPGVCELVTQTLASGKGLPDGLRELKQTPTYVVRVSIGSTKKGILEN